MPQSARQQKAAKQKGAGDGMPALDAMLCFSLYAANNAMNRVYQPLLEPLGLTYPQYLVLLALWEEEGRGVGQIGGQIGLESNTLTPLLKRMEAAGLLSRRRSEEDERQVLVHLTPKGKALRRKADSIPGCILSASGLTLPELTALRNQLQTLRVKLEESQADDTS
jgi:DNA-binding MarR family transcriptional regulator